MREWHNQSHVRWYCRYHIIIVPKSRQKAIFGTLRKDIGKILRELCEQMGIELLVITDSVDLARHHSSSQKPVNSPANYRRSACR